MEITKASIGGLLQRMYDSEINFRLECMWDGGFTWSLTASDREQRPRVQIDDELSGDFEFLCITEAYRTEVATIPHLIPDWLDRGGAYSIEVAVRELSDSICKHYPASDFTLWYTAQQFQPTDAGSPRG